MILDQEPAMIERHYSDLFSCLYDQPAPVGDLGRGTHYSVFRSVQWRDIDGDFRDSGRFHDFAVLWDEDHDERVIRFVELLHMHGLLWPVVFVGERKGAVTVLLWHDIDPTATRPDWFDLVKELAGSAAEGDYWNSEFGRFDRDPANQRRATRSEGIVNDRDERVNAYLQAIDVLWQLGEKRRETYAPVVLPPGFTMAAHA